MITKVKTLWTGLEPSKRRIVKPILGAALGAVLGYAYYATIGCSSGGCAITSDPMISTFWGAAIGGLATAG